jgi:hypothetical protein
VPARHDFSDTSCARGAVKLSAGSNRSHKLSSIPFRDIYEIGFSDGRRGYDKRDTFLLDKWDAEQQNAYDQGYRAGEQQRLANSFAACCGR